jgi:4-hydroxybenzoyl-CoA reductase subunit beta
MVAEETYIKPITVAEALKLASAHVGHFKFIAGGTDVIVNRFQGNDDMPVLIDISGLEELKTVEVRGDELKIGALTRLSDLRKNEWISNQFPALIEAADSVGSPLIRKTATIGGNILCENRCLYFNQSEWWRESIGKCLKCEGDVCIATGGKKACFSELVSDTCPALISMNARIEYVDLEGIHQMPLQDMYSGDGVKPINLSETTLLTAILLPLNRGFEVVFNKLRQRKSLEFTSLTSSVSKDKNGNLIIALSGVDPGPVVIKASAAEGISSLITKAIKKSRAIDNDMLSRKYRKQILSTYLTRSFEQLNVLK